MIETRRNKWRVMLAFGLLLMVVGVVNGRESAGTESSASSTTLATSSVEEDKAEARWVEDDSVAAKPGRSVGRKDSKDSYLEALRHSRTSTDPREGIVAVDGTGSGSLQRRKEYVQGPVYAPKRSEANSRIVQHSPVDRDSFSMVPSDSYTLPSRTAVDFAGVRNSYGPPQTPRPAYGPAFNEYYSSEYAGNAYLPPQQGEGRAYGPPSSSYGPPSGPSYGYGNGHATSETQLTLPSIDFSWPFALKLNAFTLAKILLKLVIFKMIVKFIAIICLLLFIPKLEIKKGNKGSSNDDEEEEGRGIVDANSSIWERLNRLTVVVNEAVEQYRASNEDCSSFGCRDGRGTTSNDRIWPDYEQLLTSYILEETRSLRTNT
ncbi:uncharacterized protein LOC114880675 isoform X1 [Osmia bicornis bicornis]|uniref:uncharacterized protein LOC114880675 isoform X1 n=1 Tax=Osmia bicornis bicornis TaxID=1437191 RepID=UPI001EAEF5A9|nr:uncharacterized protein LOC114880675 isoform X1 [Osmia bicornis bicornis]